MTGSYHGNSSSEAGYCDTGPYDGGSHTVAAEVTEEFLDFSAKQGNDLKQSGMVIGGPGAGMFPGLKGGCKWYDIPVKPDLNLIA